MPIVKPDFTGIDKTSSMPPWTNGRYVFRVVDVAESQKLDRNGNNALVIKFEATAGTNPACVGKRISKWIALAGPGTRFLFRMLKTLNPEYKGGAFNTTDLLGKMLEGEVVVAPGTDGKDYPSLERIHQHLAPGSVTNGLPKVADSFDDFDV